MKQIYLCDYCNETFENETECIRHEAKHITVKELLRKYRGSIECPICKGEGVILAQIGYIKCNLCGGKRVVYKKVVEKTVYKQV